METTPQTQTRPAMQGRKWTAADNERLLAASIGIDAEGVLHAETEAAYAGALDSLDALGKRLRYKYAPITPATAEHLAKVRRFARLLADLSEIV